MTTRPTNKTPFIKVCGQTHPSTVDCASAYGARFVGFIFHQGSPRCVSPEMVASINSANVGRVGVFVRQGADEILSIVKQAKLDFVQLHGKQTREDAALIGPQRIIRVLWPEHCESLAELQQQIDDWSPYCAYYLLDAGAYGQAGGQGRRLDVSEFGKLRFPHPWILAGGLSGDNVADALSRCTPDGLDFNSGIEIAPGIKMPDRMLGAFTAVSRASRA